MFTNKSVLYWLREPDLDPDKLNCHLSLDECSGFIPVFCFDKRDEHFFKPNTEYKNYLHKTIQEIAELRFQLQQKGSNLLIVNGSYEVLIPSLARILNVNEVVAGATLVPRSAKLDELADFRKRKTEEIEYYLKMHSIAMNTVAERANRHEFSELKLFPPFPEINPGTIPVL